MLTDGRLREKHKCIVMRIDEESGVYQLGVPQGQGDSSAPSTTDPLICGFRLVTTPNTRGKTVEQSIVTWMFADGRTDTRHTIIPPTFIGRTKMLLIIAVTNFFFMF